MLVFSPLSHMDCQLHTGRAWDLWRAGFWVFSLAGAKTQFSRKNDWFSHQALGKVRCVRGQRLSSWPCVDFIAR